MKTASRINRQLDCKLDHFILLNYFVILNKPKLKAVYRTTHQLYFLRLLIYLVILNQCKTKAISRATRQLDCIRLLNYLVIIK